MNASAEPATEGDYYWPKYTIPELEYKEFSLGLTTDRAVRGNECAFWNYYVPDLIRFIGKISLLTNDRATMITLTRCSLVSPFIDVEV